jgi:DNA-binding NarL/FixJ family response regulator
MGGKETILRLLQIDPDIKAIVSSGYSTDPIMSNYKEYGFSAVIAKPYRMAVLTECIEKLISG